MTYASFQREIGVWPVLCVVRFHGRPASMWSIGIARPPPLPKESRSMFKKLILAIGLIALPLMLSQQQASARLQYRLRLTRIRLLGRARRCTDFPTLQFGVSRSWSRSRSPRDTLSVLPVRQRVPRARRSGLPQWIWRLRRWLLPAPSYRTPYYGGSGISFRIGF